MSDGYERGRLFNTAMLATVLADQQLVEEASAIGMEAIASARSVRSMRGATYLMDLGQRLAPYRKATVVSALFDSMIEIGISPSI